MKTERAHPRSGRGWEWAVAFGAVFLGVRGGFCCSYRLQRALLADMRASYHYCSLVFPLVSLGVGTVLIKRLPGVSGFGLAKPGSPVGQSSSEQALPSVC